MSISPCQHLMCSERGSFDFEEFIQLFNIQNHHDIEKLVVYAISYNKSKIITTLFHYNNFDALMEKFKLEINSLYSHECLSLVPCIKTYTNETITKQESNLFDHLTIDSSKRITFDNQIEYPLHCKLSHHTIKHLCATNTHFKTDNDTYCNREYIENIITITVKPCYMTYFDHSILLGHYQIALTILELGGWKSFINGNFMIYLREMLLKESNDTQKNNYYLYILKELYSMGADIQKVYHTDYFKGFTDCDIYNVIKECNEIFETRQIALTKILQHIIEIIDFDVCFKIISFIPFINQPMIQKMSHQKGMILTKK